MARFIGVPKQLGSRGAVGANVRVIGVPEALIKLGLVNKIARIELGFLAHASGKAMEGRTAFYCPVITGNLRSSIKLTHTGPYSWFVSVASREGDVASKNDKEYAGFVEFGTSRMAPRFFMRRAYEETRVEAVVGLSIIARRLEAL
jgi:HK97 gp10 family phage protein